MTAMARSLEVAYRKGKPMAAYLYLNDGSPERTARSEERDAGLVVDYGGDGAPIGLEITAPKLFSLAALNAVLASIGQPPSTEQEVAPLLRPLAA